ncbi:MAG: hypothetical protein KGI27_06275 [Thaumarchaeota archaeon]|nr:hypothetical protein [Nitrososphaerota archaeon]
MVPISLRQVLSNTEMPDGFSAVGDNVAMFHGTSGGPMGDFAYQSTSPAVGPLVIQAAPVN